MESLLEEYKNNEDFVDGVLSFVEEDEDRKSILRFIRKLSYRTVYDCFKRVMTKLGLPETRFHDLRHTYAVAAIKSGDDNKTVQENLGHATAAFTLDVYGHVTNQMKEASASRMELFISAVLS